MSGPSPSTPTTADRGRFAAYARRCNRRLEQALPAPDEPPERLHAAMRYAVLGGGKRVRPLLAYGAAEALGAPAAIADPIGAAIELIHAYSLVHDDLPAMDDDALRRGRPTCHIAFDEATAILAGDALQAHAFGMLAEGVAVGIDPARLGPLTAELAAACGSRGMAGGQVIDLQVVGRAMTLEALEEMHRLKTGALIGAAVRMPAIAVDAPPEQFEALTCYGQCIGLAFQIQDDILDVEASTEELGKPQGSDADRNKPTFPALLGLAESRSKARALLQQALAALAALPGDASLLEALAHFIVDRRQ